MRSRTFFTLTVAATLAVLAFFTLLGSDRQAELPDNAVGEPPLEQSFGFVYPYLKPADEIDLSTEPNDPAFMAPGQAILDVAEALPCPEGAEEHEINAFHVALCIPAGWTLSVNAAGGLEDGAVALSFFEPSASADQVIVSLALSTENDVFGFPDCPEPGSLLTETGEVEVCFLADKIITANGPAVAFSGMWFRPSSKSEWAGLIARDSSVWGHAARAGGPALP